MITPKKRSDKKMTVRFLYLFVVMLLVSGYSSTAIGTPIRTVNDWFEINANQLGGLFFNPTIEERQKKYYPKAFNKIDWRWFLLFNPFIF